MSAPSRLPPVWVLAAVVAAACAAHGLTLRNGFVYDDPMILDAPILEQPLNVVDIFSPTAYFAPATWARELSWRPTTTLTHLVDRTIARDVPAWHHGVNVALHAVAAALLVCVAMGWGWTMLGAGAAGLLFAVHPLGSEAVGVVTFREDLLALVGCLVSAWLVLPAHAVNQPGRLIGAGACVFAACGAKEVALTWPVVMAVAAAVLPCDEPRRARAWRWIAPALIGVLVFLPLRFALFVADDTGWVGHPGGSMLVTAPTMARVCAGYAGLFLWPAALDMDHNPTAVTSLLDPGALVGVALGAVLVAVAWLARRRAPPVTVACVAIGAALLPVLDVVPLANIMAERYCYVPLAGVALLAGWAFAAAAAGPFAGQRPAWLAAGVLVIVAAGARTALRAGDLRNDDTLWEVTAARSPGSFRAPQVWGQAFQGVPPWPQEVRYRLAILDRIEKARGGPMVRGERAEAYATARRELNAACAAFDPKDRAGLWRVKSACLRLALELRREGLRLAPPWSPEEANSWLQLGVCWRELADVLRDRFSRLESRLQQLAREIHKRDAAGFDSSALSDALTPVINEAAGLSTERDAAYAEAERLMTRALPRIPRPLRPGAYENLAVVASASADPQKLERVRELCEKALAIDSSKGFAWYNLGIYWQKRAEGADSPKAGEPFITQALEAYRRAQSYLPSAQAALLNEYALAEKLPPGGLGDNQTPPPPGTPSALILAILRNWNQLSVRLPTELDFRRQLAITYMRHKQHDDAIRILEEQVALDPRWADGWKHLYMAYNDGRPERQQGFPEDALRALDQGLANNPAGVAEALINPWGARRELLAKIRWIALKALLEARGTSAPVVQAIGWTFIEMRLFDDAETRLREALSAWPEEARAAGLSRDLAWVVDRRAADAEAARLSNATSLPATERVAAARQALARGQFVSALELLSKGAVQADTDEAEKAAWRESGGRSLHQQVQTVADLAAVADAPTLLARAKESAVAGAAGQALYLLGEVRRQDAALADGAEATALESQAREALFGPAEDGFRAVRDAEAAGHLGQATIRLTRAAECWPQAYADAKGDEWLARIWEKIAKAAGMVPNQGR